MISRELKIAILIAFVAASSGNAYDNGMSVMEFLNMGVSARNSGTGNALSALSDGAIAAYYNPAGLTLADNYQIAVMHSEWYQDLRYEYLGAAIPIGSRSNLGTSFSYLNLGSINGYTSSNLSTGNINAYDWSLGVAYGHELSSRFSLGLGAKVLSERLDDVSAYGYAADLGMQYRYSQLGLGLALRNLGPDVKYDGSSSPLPSRLEAGISYWLWAQDLALLAGAGLPLRGQPSFRAGLEYTYAGAFIIRGGFDSAELNADRGGFSLGAGFNLSGHSVDYAYNVNNLLGGTHLLSFVVRFGNNREEVYYSTIRDPQETYASGAAISEKEESPKVKIVYLVCAGRYGVRADAEKHVSALEKFGYSPKIEMVGEDEYRVVLAKADRRSKAEKLRKEFEASSISCFIEEK
jgi:hypothetical protein